MRQGIASVFKPLLNSQLSAHPLPLSPDAPSKGYTGRQLGHDGRHEQLVTNPLLGADAHESPSACMVKPVACWGACL